MLLKCLSTWLVLNRVPVSEKCNERHSILSENPEPIMENGIHSTILWPSKRSSNPDTPQPEAPSTPKCQEVCTTAHATDGDHQRFQEGITVSCKDEKGLSAHQEERDSFVVNKNGLEAEQ